MHITALQIENIKCFKDKDEDLKLGSEQEPLSKGMNVFVGGNASGKTTLLKCIAMALIGPRYADILLEGDTSNWIRYETPQGKVTFSFSEDVNYDHGAINTKTAELTITKK